MVNKDSDSSSGSSRGSEDGRDLLTGDIYVGNFGDDVCMKKDNTLRLGFQNIGGFSTKPGKLKEDNIRAGITKWEFDVFGMVETNVDWRKVQEKEKLPSRTREWWANQHVSWAHNRTGPPRQVRQYGGTALFSIDQASHRVIGKGQDNTDLGRWTWTKYKGRGNQTLKIFSAYRPNPPQGPFTVYAQQNAFFHSINRSICPRQAFLIDLATELKESLTAGDHIILMMDGNSNMKNSDISKKLQELTLREVILERHGRKGPATHKRNATSTPIDGLWMSQGLQIEQGGYFAYDEVIPSDHRCIWADITFQNALGHNMAPLHKRQPKRLHCKDPRLVENYVHLFHQYARPLNLFQRVTDLEKNLRSMSKFEAMQKYEELDSIRCDATAFAERHCRKLRTGQVAFSPELNLIRMKIRAWLLLINKAKKRKVSSRLLKRALKKANLPAETRQFSEETVQERLKQEYKNYYRVKGEAIELRMTSLEGLATALADQGNTEKEKILKALREREQQRSTARKIRFLQGKLRTGSTTMVTTVDASGNRVEITDKEEMEKAILASNRLKFSQSSNTPFYLPPLKEEFGFKGLTAAAQATLAGNYTPSEDIDERILEVIAQWQMPEAVRALGPLKMEMSLESYRNFWKKAKEDTSCYPSAMSFSTMKAGASDPDIAATDCSLTRIPLTVGFAPRRWKFCLDVMLMKKSGITDLSGLRTIVLFPVDCNFAFKHVGRSMMAIAEKTSSLAPEQYGSRKRHKAIDLAVNKSLTFDILRQLKRPGAICSNDAKSCYDLIGHTQASLSMQRVGVPKNIINCIFSTLQEAIHKVRTGYGDSKAHYGGKVWLVPIHGIGQGNGAGPAIWAVVSTPLLNVLREKGFGCEILCPLTSEFFRFVGYAFVDDTDIIQSTLEDHPEKARAQLQQAIDTWEFSLKATCGALVPEKTVWWLVSFNWDGTSWRYASLQDSPGELTVKDLNNNRKVITRLEPNQAYETLGVFLAPDGKLDQQFEKMKKAATTWADSLRTGCISRNEAWLALQSTILRTLTYPLAALRLTPSQCEAIMSPILQYCLPAIGVCRNFPRALVYSTLDYFGLNIRHLFTVQEMIRIKDIILHTYNNTLTGRLYKTSMEITFIELGFVPQLKPSDISILETLTTPSLVQASLCFLAKHNITLIHNIEIPLLRENDQLIMSSLLQLSPPMSDLFACNYCRLFLQVCCLSEISTGDGSAITDNAWSGQPDYNHHKQRSWPKLNKPPSSYWHIWRLWLQKAFLGRGRRLRHPLGRWFKWDTSWQWYTDQEGYLYSMREGKWYSHPLVLRRKTLPMFELEANMCGAPNHPRRATTYIKGSRIVCTGTAEIMPQRLREYTSFTKFLQEQQDLHWCTKNCFIVNEGRNLVEAIISGLQGNIMAISDGSYKDSLGTAAWTIGTEEEESLLSGTVVCPGAESDQSSYRSELTGLYAILAIIDQLCQFYSVNEGMIQIACDGLSALNMAFDHPPILTRDLPDYDLLGAIFSLRRNMRLSLSFKHVKGHQDETQEELDIWAKRNIAMDTKAKQYLIVAASTPRHFDIKGEPWQLWVGGKKITANLCHNIYEAVHRVSSTDYWASKVNDPSCIKEVDWQLVGKALRTVPRTRRVFLSKHISGMCGVGKFMKRWGEWETDACPRCGQIEDAPHVWTCKGRGTEEIWMKSLAELERLLQKLNTDPNLTHIILTHLKGWWAGTGTYFEAPRDFKALVDTQNTVGWRRFFEGWMVSHWAKLQQNYYDILRSSRTGRRWTIAIILKLWNIAWDLWAHRNGILHEQENRVTQSEIQQLNSRVSQTYSDLHSRALRQYDLHLVCLSRSELLKKDITYKMQWLSVAEPVLQSGRTEDWRERTRSERMIRGMRRGLFAWLQR